MQGRSDNTEIREWGTRQREEEQREEWGRVYLHSIYRMGGKLGYTKADCKDKTEKGNRKGESPILTCITINFSWSSKLKLCEYS